MAVKIQEIKTEGLDFELDRPGFVVEAAGELLVFHQMRAGFHLEWEDGQIRVTGGIAGDLTIHCSRCYREFPLAVREDFDFRAIPASHLRFPENQELSSDELEVTFLEGDEIDLEEIIRENVYLSLPLRPLCAESCRGLCPQCGADLNEGDCACRERRLDPRLQPLEILRRKISSEAP